MIINHNNDDDSTKREWVVLHKDDAGTVSVTHNTTISGMCTMSLLMTYDEACVHIDRLQFEFPTESFSVSRVDNLPK